MTGETPEQPAGAGSIDAPQQPGGRPAPPAGTTQVVRGLRGRHRLEDLERLVQISIDLNATADLEDLLYRILDGAKEMMKAEDASVMLMDSSGVLRFAAIDSRYREALKTISLNLGEGIAGWVALQGEVVIASDPYQDPRFSQKGDAASGHRTSNMICVPLRTPERIIGTLQVINRRESYFTPEDVPLCLSLANIAAIAIENLRLHQATERNLARIQQLQEARTEFINLISHELRTPLTVIQGGLDIMRSGIALDDETRDEFLNAMAANAVRLKRLIEDVFIVNDMEGLSDRLILKDVDVLQMASAFQGFYDAESGAPTLRLDLPEGADSRDFTVRADKEKIYHAMAHLLDNARKFSPAGGTVTLRVRRDEPLQSLRIAVIDQGIGIPEESQERVFDRFYQADSSSTRKYGGTGVGLYVARKVVESHGGMIWCRSEPNRGSEFEIALPL